MIDLLCYQPGTDIGVAGVPLVAGYPAGADELGFGIFFGPLLAGSPSTRAG